MRTIVALIIVVVGAVGIAITNAGSTPIDQTDGYITLLSTGGQYIGAQQVAKLIKQLKQVKLEGPNANVEFESKLEELADVDSERCLDYNVFERYHFMLRKFRRSKANLVPYLKGLLEQQRELCKEEMYLNLMMALNRITDATKSHVDTLRKLIGNTGLFRRDLTKDIPDSHLFKGTLKFLPGKQVRYTRYASLEASEQFFIDRFKKLLRDCRSIAKHVGPVIKVYEELGGANEPEFDSMKTYLESWHANVAVCNNLLNKQLLQQEIAQSVIGYTAPGLEIPRNYKFDLNKLSKKK